MNKVKICTHCGRETHPQPQDYDHDTGYGHCRACLNNNNWYVFDCALLMKPGVRIDMYTARNYNCAPLTSDDSEPKVVEIWEGEKLTAHFTSHKTKAEIVAKVSTRFV